MRESFPQVLDASKRSAPPAIYLLVDKVLEWPVEKWVSAATLVFVLLQIVLILHNHFARDRRRGRHAADIREPKP